MNPQDITNIPEITPLTQWGRTLPIGATVTVTLLDTLGERVLLHLKELVPLDNGVTGCLIVWVTRTMAQHMMNYSQAVGTGTPNNNFPTLYCDGTFKSAPAGFLQYFTIHMMLNNRLYPVFHCLFSHKHQYLYHRLFTFIRAQIVDWNLPFRIFRLMADYEDAIRAAVLSSNIDWIVDGCYFHFCQAVYRKCVENGLSVQ